MPAAGGRQIPIKGALRAWADILAARGAGCWRLRPARKALRLVVRRAPAMWRAAWGQRAAEDGERAGPLARAAAAAGDAAASAATAAAMGTAGNGAEGKALDGAGRRWCRGDGSVLPGHWV